jgi:hypothetical protein
MTRKRKTDLSGKKLFFFIIAALFPAALLSSFRTGRGIIAQEW